MRFSDPRCPDLEEMLGGLGPRDELVYRLAIMGLSEHCRGDPFYQRRTAEIQKQLRLSTAQLAEVFTEVRELRERLAGDIGATP